MLVQLSCRVCGGELKPEGSDTYRCLHCEKVFVKKTEDDAAEKLKKVLDAQKYELMSNARLNLWNAMHQGYLYKDECVFYARALKCFVPSDYLANFAETACNKGDVEISAFLDSSLEDNIKTYADAVLDFLVKLGRKATYASALKYLSRAYDTDSPEYEKYSEQFKAVKAASKPQKVKASEETEKFWGVFEKVLDEHDKPFMINTALSSSNGEKRCYSTINNKKANCSMCLGIDFRTQQKNIRISIYFANIKYRKYYDCLKAHKAEIDRILNYDAIWNEMGKKNPDARRIETTLSYESHDLASYRDVIERAIPVIDRYLDVCRKYLPQVLTAKPIAKNQTGSKTTHKSN